MNWEALGAISEAIGVIAIFVSLIYVAIQIRQNTEQVSRGIEADQLAAFERNVESGNRVRELLLVNPELSKILLRGFASQGNLSTTEKFRFGMLIRNIFSSMQGAYVRDLSMENELQEIEGTMRVLDEVLRNPGVQEWLERNDPDWRCEFRRVVELRLAAIKQQ